MNKTTEDTTKGPVLADTLQNLLAKANKLKEITLEGEAEAKKAQVMYEEGLKIIKSLAILQDYDHEGMPAVYVDVIRKSAAYCDKYSIRELVLDGEPCFVCGNSTHLDLITNNHVCLVCEDREIHAKKD